MPEKRKVVKKIRPTNRLHLNDLEDLVLVNSDSFDANYTKFQDKLEKVMKTKKIFDFTFNASDGVIGAVCQRYKFFQTQDSTGYVSISFNVTFLFKIY